MKLTNKHELPEVFENFDKKNPYSMGEADISTSTLIDSPQIQRLKLLNYTDLSEDVSTRLFSILGTAVHAILEGGAADGDIVERRLFADWDGCVITGQIDLMTPHLGGYRLCDYKTCRAFAIQKEPNGKADWHNQLNIYGALARMNGIDVTGLEIVAIIRDWSAAGLKRNADYPIAPVVRIPIPIWPEDKVDQYISSRIEAHSAVDTPECTPEERWENPPRYAAMKILKTGKVAVRATRVFDSEPEAEEFISSSSQEYAIEKRPSKSTRCEGDYCGVSQFCKQWKTIKGETNE